MFTEAKKQVKQLLGLDGDPSKFAYQIISEPVRFYDIGAATGLQKEWDIVRKFGQFFLFEPHPESYQKLLEMYKNYPNIQSLKLGLSDIDGDVILTETNVPTGSTIMTFDEDSEGFRYPDREYIFPLKKHQLTTRRLDSVISELKLLLPDLIKLDTQGSELRILQGLGEYLKDVVCIHIEIGLVRTYKEQSEFFKTIEWFSDNGFEPFEFSTVRGLMNGSKGQNYFRNSLNWRDSYSSIVTQRPWEFDVTFFRRFKTLLDLKDPIKIKKTIIGLMLFGFYFEAVDLVGRATEVQIFNPNEATELKSNIADFLSAVGRFRRLQKMRQLMGRN